MKTFIHRFLRPPAFQDPHLDRQAKALHYLLLLGFVVTLIFSFLVYFVSENGLSGPLLSGVMVVVVSFLFVYLHRGKVLFASRAIIATSYIAQIIALLMNGGIRDQAMVTFIMLLTLAGVFLSEREALSLGGLTFVVVIVLYSLEIAGLIETESSAPVEFDDLLIALIAVAVTTTFIHHSIQQVVKSEARIREQSTALKRQTAELQTTQQALIEAKESAESANQAKSVFLSNMSHELRTPLNGVLGYTQILQRDDNLMPNQMHSLAMIRQNGEYLLALVSEILDLSKIEAEKLTLYPAAVYLPGLLRSIADSMRARAEIKQLDFKVRLAGELPVGVEVDETRLRQVLTNLLDNAIKFTDEGYISLGASLAPSAATKEAPNHTSSVSLRFEISDSGIGISPADMKKIFLPFEQVGELQHRLGGTGLGLSIVRRLLTAMGGELYLDSELGQGSRFWFDLSLPLAMATVTEAPESHEMVVGYQGPQRTILIVDDQLDNILVVQGLLVPLGFKVLQAQDGQQAINVAHQSNPDLILMDLSMPGLDGFETTKIIRQHSELAQAIIIAVSAKVFAEDQVRSQEAGCDAFLPKPINENALLALLGDFLHLTWVYKAAAQLALEPMVFPPHSELDLLCELALMGKMSHIRERADYLSQLDQQYLPFAEQLRGLALDFDDEKIMALVKAALQASLE